MRATLGVPPRGVTDSGGRMRNAKWILALVGLLACGLIAIGCGDDDEDTGTDEPATEESSEDTSSEDTSEDTSAEGSTPDDVLAACEDAIAGTPGEDAGQAGCEAAADAFETCLAESEDIEDDSARETALAACQDAADQAVGALESVPGG